MLKKLSFKVSAPKNNSIASLITEANNFNCQIEFDFQNSSIKLEKVCEAELDSIITFLQKYFAIFKISINNAVASSEPIPLKETKPTKISGSVLVRFPERSVEQLLNKYCKTLYWAMFEKECPKNFLTRYISHSINEITMRYTTKDCVEFSIGDIVHCNYGMNLPGEACETYYGIICNIYDNGTPFIVPVIPSHFVTKSHSFLRFAFPSNGTCSQFTIGTALLDMAQYLHPLRIINVVGEVNSNFLTKLINKLLSAFDFTGNIAKLLITSDEVTLAK